MAQSSILARFARPKAHGAAGLTAIALLLLAGCVGQMAGGAGAADESDDDTAIGGGQAGGAAGKAVGPHGGAPGSAACEVGERRLARLTNVQFDNTVRDLLGDDSRPARVLPADDASSGFEIAAPIADLTVNKLGDVAEALAARAVTNLPQLLGCDPAQAGEDACAQDFIGRFGARAFRRPLLDAELSGLVALYTKVKGLQGFSGGVRAVVEAALQSPQFLYVVEEGAAGSGSKASALAPHEIASRLSYFLWASMPDDALFEAARSGKLSSSAGVAAEVDRMLKSERARDGLRSFFRQWLRLDLMREVAKDAKAFPQWNAQLLTSMRGSMEAFVDDVLWKKDARLSTLLTSSTVFADASLSKAYGFGSVTGSGFSAVTVDAKARKGFLTHPALMSMLALPDHGDPIRRGAFVREDVFCQPLPSPPESLNVVAPQPKPGLTTRQLFAEHSNNAACSVCHKLIDPVGFAFESYDGMGAYRTKEGDRPIDTAGEVTDTQDMDGPFGEGGELIERIAASAQVEHCFVKHVLLFSLQTPGGDCSVDAASEAFRKTHGDIKALVTAIATAPEFSMGQAPSMEARTP